MFCTSTNAKKLNKFFPMFHLPFCSPTSVPKKQLDPVHFNCLLNNKNEHNLASEIWVYVGVEGLGGVKRRHKRQIRKKKKELVGKKLLLKMETFSHLMTEFVLLKRMVSEVRMYRRQKLSGWEPGTRVLILALPLYLISQYKILSRHLAPLDLTFHL